MVYDGGNLLWRKNEPWNDASSYFAPATEVVETGMNYHSYEGLAEGFCSRSVRSMAGVVVSEGVSAPLVVGDRGDAVKAKKKMGGNNIRGE